MLPDVDGYTVCRRLRSAPRTERLLIIMVTGRDKPTEKTLGLDSARMITLPSRFDPQELLARVRSMLRLHRAEQDLWTRNQALAALECRLADDRPRGGTAGRAALRARSSAGFAGAAGRLDYAALG